MYYLEMFMKYGNECDSLNGMKYLHTWDDIVKIDR